MDHSDSLAAVPLFADLDRHTLKSLGEQGKSRTYQPGDVIVSEGNRATALYIILSGQVEIERSEVAGPVGELGPGDFFGELALIEDHPRTATVRALTETTCMLYTVWDFRALLGEYPQIALPIMNALIARLHRIERHRAE